VIHAELASNAGAGWVRQPDDDQWRMTSQRGRREEDFRFTNPALGVATKAILKI
jgi:hypothetical protein